MVIENKTGILVLPKDVRSLSEAIERFLGDSGLQEKLSEGARSHAVKHYSYQKNASAYRSLYESLI
jgi:glycosyltransferase involved in cell wall biosynthesis